MSAHIKEFGLPDWNLIEEITRYLWETQPEMLRGLLVERMPHEALENQIAASLEMNREEFWGNIDQIVVSHFKQQALADSG